MKVLKIVLPAFFFMSLAFGADKFVDLPEGDHYVPSRLSYQGIAQVIDDGLDLAEDVKVTSVEENFLFSTSNNIFNRLVPANAQFTFRVFFNADATINPNIKLHFYCDLNIIYKNIESQDYYLAAEGSVGYCKLVPSDTELQKLTSLMEISLFTFFPPLILARTDGIGFELGPEQLAELMQ